MPTSSTTNKTGSAKGAKTTAKGTTPGMPVAASAHKVATEVATKIGVVESDKRAKSRTVVLKFKTMHPKYGKYVSGKTVLQVHDENNESHLGDTVEVKPCRPRSKTKHWELLRVVEKSQRVELIQK